MVKSEARVRFGLLCELAKVTAVMRYHQRAYFKSRRRGHLTDAKREECECDRLLEVLEEFEGGLFGLRSRTMEEHLKLNGLPTTD